MQKARASLWKIKPEWLTQTDWNMDENHGNRLFSKQFMEAHSETRHLGKEPCANQRIPTPPATKISQEQMCQASLPLPLLARREQPHKLSAVFTLRRIKGVVSEPKVILQYRLFGLAKLRLHYRNYVSTMYSVPVVASTLGGASRV